MKRLGKFTGKIYTDDEIKDMRECGVQINDLETDAMLKFLKERNRLDCAFCIPGMGCCPEKLKAVQNGR